MTTLALISRRGRRAAVVVMASALVAPSIVAQDSTTNSLRANRADQQEVRQHTEALANQIQTLIDELANNGISGEDVKVLQATKAVLHNLSAQEMDRVIASLQKADEAAGTQEGDRSLVDAYTGQQGIMTVFRRILADYEQRQAADELPLKFAELAKRQTEVLLTTVQVARDTAALSPSELTTTQSTTTAIVQSDQSALGTDVAAAKAMLDKAAQSATGDEGQAMAQAEDDFMSGGLQGALDGANADLASGHLLQATGEQKTARRVLLLVAKDLNPPASTSEALADNAAALEKLIGEQKDVLDQTKAADGVEPRATGLDGKEGLLVLEADSLQQDMMLLSPAPAGLVKDAIVPMQMSRGLLGPSGGTFAQAEVSERAAIAKLEEAAKLLNQQVADTQQAEDEDGKDSTAKLEKLHEEIEAAITEQEKTADSTTQVSSATPPDPNALATEGNKEGEVEKTTAGITGTAAPLSLGATTDISKAVTSMIKAQTDLTDPSTAGAAPGDQKTALTDLKKADAEVQAQIAANGAPGNAPGLVKTGADGKPMPGGLPGIASTAPTPPSPGSRSLTGAQNLTGGDLTKYPLRDVSGPGRAVVYQNRTRDRLQASQGEPRPLEYASMIDAYMKNLSDQDTSSSQ